MNARNIALTLPLVLGLLACNNSSVDGTEPGTLAPSEPLITSVTGDLPSGTGWQESSMTIGTQLRRAIVYRPTAATNLPLLIVLHGTGDGPEAFIANDLGGTDAIASLIASTEPAILIFPAAVEQPDGDWDHDVSGIFWRTATDNPDTNPDLFWMRYLIQNARSQYGINSRRVYALGHSSGGFMSLKLAAVFPTLFAGVGANSAGWARCLPEANGARRATQQYAPGGSATCASILASAPSTFTCRNTNRRPFDALPVPAVPTILSHANDDDVISPYYSCDLAAALAASGGTVQMMPLFSGGHFASPDTISNAWNWLRAR